MKIKVKLNNLSCKIEQNKKGEWIDLKAAETVKLEAPSIHTVQKTVSFDSALIPLGLSMELPKYFEANIVPRSSTFNNFKIILSNSFGIIDSTYKGDNDEWKFNAIGRENGGVLAYLWRHLGGQRGRRIQCLIFAGHWKP